MRVVGGDNDHGLTVSLGKVEGFLNDLVDLLGLSDHAAGVGCVVCLVDGCGLDLEEEALVGALVVEKLDGLLGHLGCGRLVAAISFLADLRLGGAVGLHRHGLLELAGHVLVVEQAEHRLVLVRDGDALEALLVVDNLVALGNRVLADGLAGLPVGAAVVLLGQERVAVLATLLNLGVEVLAAAAQGDVGAGVDDLLGDGAETAVFASFSTLDRLRVAGRRVVAALGDVRVHRARGRILDLGGGDVTGAHTGVLRHLQQVLVRLAGDVNGQRAVVGLRTGGPARCGRGGVGDVLTLAVLAHGEGRVSTCRSQLVEALEAAVSALEVITSSSDLLVAHAVAQDEDDVACLGVGVALAALAKLGAVTRLRGDDVAVGIDGNAGVLAVEGLLRRLCEGGRQVRNSQRRSADYRGNCFERETHVGFLITRSRRI